MKTTLTVLNSFTALKFFGEKTQTFLQGQLTCDMRALSQHGAYSLAACCDHRGKMVANFWVVCWQDDYLFILPKTMASLVQNHLQKYAVFSKVKIAQEDYFIAEKKSVGSSDGSPSTHEREKDYVLILLPSKTRYLLISKNNPFPNITINSDESGWKKNNIADQLCILYPETSLLFTPHMIGLEKLGGVSFDKGCYVGQEIVARTEYLGAAKRHLQNFTLASEQASKPGDPFNNKHGKSIGIIVESVFTAQNTVEILAVVQDQTV